MFLVLVSSRVSLVIADMLVIGITWRVLYRNNPREAWLHKYTLMHILLRDGQFSQICMYIHIITHMLEPRYLLLYVSSLRNLK